MAFDTIKSGLVGAKNAVDLNETITEAIDMVLDFMQTLTAIMAILDPAEPGQLDEYCAGYVYGLEGSKIMVTIANRLINHKDKDGKIKSTLDPKAPLKAPKISAPKVNFKPKEAIKNAAKDIEKGVLGGLQDVVGTLNKVIQEKTGATIAAGMPGGDEL